MPENTDEMQEKGRIKKGKSGNPMGKPKEARHKASLMAEMHFENEIMFAIASSNKHGMGICKWPKLF